MSWNRYLWAVRMSSKGEKGMIIGDAWDHVSEPKYKGEPCRSLLFRTRKLAREWCREAKLKSLKHSSDWKFKPVRVFETLAEV